MQVNDRNSRHVLILAHSWPPDGSVGAVRPVYLCRQLASLGFQPVVITVKETYYEVKNSGGIAGTESAFVIRTRCIPNPRLGYQWLKNVLHKLLLKRSKVTRAETTVSFDATRQGASPNIRSNLASLLHTPDEFAGWFPFALAASLRAFKRYRPCCVISTGPPHTSHLVGLALSRMRNVGWIADFRDPWAWHDLGPGTSRLWSDRLNARLERLVVNRADRIVCVAPGITAGYADRYPQRHHSVWQTITNGFDFDEFRNLPPTSKWPVFTISYVGTFDFNRSPRLLLTAVSSLIRDGSISAAEVRVRIVGPSTSAEGRPLRDLIEELGLREVVDLISMIPRPQALQELRRADALLLIAGSQTMSVAAKLYEYLASGRPIILVSNECAAADIVNETGAGSVIAPDDLKSMKLLISKLREERANRLRDDAADELRLSEPTLKYGWDSLGKRYATLIESCSRLASTKHRSE